MTQIGQSTTGLTVALPSAHSAVSLTWAMLTDVGLRRQVNEDSLLAISPIFAVADGMGGHSAGDVASAAVVRRLGAYAQELETDQSLVLEPARMNAALNKAVDDMASGEGVTDQGTGTTVTGAALTVVGGAPHWLIFNIGDSRVYRLFGGMLEQLTVDHSVVQELVDAGHITREEAEVHPQGNVITRAVGFHDAPVPDYRVIPVEVGSRIVVCSDGLTKELTTHGIRHFLLSQPSAADAASALVEAALDNGGRDNVTVIVLDVLAVNEVQAQPDSAKADTFE